MDVFQGSPVPIGSDGTSFQSKERTGLTVAFWLWLGWIMLDNADYAEE